MTELFHAAAFVGYLALGREQAAIYAHGTGLGEPVQLALALAYYSLLVAAVWQIGRRLLAAGKHWLPRTSSLLSFVTRPMRQAGQTRRASSPRKAAWLLPVVLGLALIPSGFWANVAILRQRGVTAAGAQIWLVPVNVLTYGVYFYLLWLIKLAGLKGALGFVSGGMSWIFAALLTVVVSAILADLGARAWRRLRPYFAPIV